MTPAEKRMRELAAQAALMPRGEATDLSNVAWPEGATLAYAAGFGYALGQNEQAAASYDAILALPLEGEQGEPAKHPELSANPADWPKDDEPAPAREPSAPSLVRYGLNEYEEGKPVLSPIDNGYWTPWHIAKEELDRLRAEAENFHMAYRMKCDEETKAQTVEIDRLRAENAKVTTARDDFRRQLGAEREHGKRMQIIADEVRAENAALREQLQGGVVVPREPTGAMLLAGINALFNNDGYLNRKEEFQIMRRGYKAMLAAAKETPC